MYVQTEWYEHKLPFLFSIPSIKSDNTIKVRGYLEKRWRYNRSPVLWLKMKNQDAYKKHDSSTITIDDFIHNTTNIQMKENRTYGIPKTAREFNKELWNFYTADLQYNRNIEVAFLPDVVYTHEDNNRYGWCRHDLRVEYFNNKLYIQSPVLHTKDDGSIPSIYAGMYYMKVLSPELIAYLLEMHFIEKKPKNFVITI